MVTGTSVKATYVKAPTKSNAAKIMIDFAMFDFVLSWIIVVQSNIIISII